MVTNYVESMTSLMQYKVGADRGSAVQRANAVGDSVALCYIVSIGRCLLERTERCQSTGSRWSTSMHLGTVVLVFVVEQRARVRFNSALLKQNLVAAVHYEETQ